ncbi:adenylosuccinate lyase [Thermoflavifilum thermophilum]|uniref:Adenylosuccinate lyase n=1 Tax=Thermoflavifilum thermophilum TaxID=1393122 RepID=A0A1I7N0T8_9BACT|nr:adenylosuccinate lyase [Thermoflavifilum thermophilum]SFV28271.1 adenylosuccinate lyase [Thermoflavifilum thermophilum]
MEEMLSPLTAISPIDGRYYREVRILGEYFSEYALIRYRVQVEVLYFLALADAGIFDLPETARPALLALFEQFGEADAQEVKLIEQTTRHDVKAVEYFVKQRLDRLGLSAYREWVHFALTSQDINNTAIPLLWKKAIEEQYWPALHELVDALEQRAEQWADVPMLARTHGQPASPTRLGKEIRVFIERLRGQMHLLQAIPFTAKFGGATGNFNAHHVAFPDINWEDFADRFVDDTLGLTRIRYTTQIEPYDHLAAQCDALRRINNILVDFCRDIWLYIAFDYFHQQVNAGEVGSSAMPHKVNPIDFENAEGNLGWANAGWDHLANKLPISRLQRDLTDSTVLRNLGVPFAHTLLAFSSLQKGWARLQLHAEKIHEDLENNWVVVAEAIQTLLRKAGYPEPYEQLKALTRGQKLNQQAIHQFIDQLQIPASLKNQMKQITPWNYVGIIK